MELYIKDLKHKLLSGVEYDCKIIDDAIVAEVLNQLKNLDVSLDLFRTTQIFQILKILIKSRHKNISKKAKRLVVKWREKLKEHNKLVADNSKSKHKPNITEHFTATEKQTEPTVNHNVNTSAGNNVSKKNVCHPHHPDKENIDFLQDGENFPEPLTQKNIPPKKPSLRRILKSIENEDNKRKSPIRSSKGKITKYHTVTSMPQVEIRPKHFFDILDDDSELDAYSMEEDMANIATNLLQNEIDQDSDEKCVITDAKHKLFQHFQETVMMNYINKNLEPRKLPVEPCQVQKTNEKLSEKSKIRFELAKSENIGKTKDLLKLQRGTFVLLDIKDTHSLKPIFDILKERSKHEKGLTLLKDIEKSGNEADKNTIEAIRENSIENKTSLDSNNSPDRIERLYPSDHTSVQCVEIEKEASNKNYTTTNSSEIMTNEERTTKSSGETLNSSDHNEVIPMSSASKQCISSKEKETVQPQDRLTVKVSIPLERLASNEMLMKKIMATHSSEQKLLAKSFEKQTLQKEMIKSTYSTLESNIVAQKQKPSVLKKQSDDVKKNKIQVKPKRIMKHSTRKHQRMDSIETHKSTNNKEGEHIFVHEHKEDLVKKSDKTVRTEDENKVTHEYSKIPQKDYDCSETACNSKHEKNLLPEITHEAENRGSLNNSYQCLPNTKIVTEVNADKTASVQTILISPEVTHTKRSDRSSSLETKNLEVLNPDIKSVSSTCKTIILNDKFLNLKKSREVKRHKQENSSEPESNSIADNTEKDKKIEETRIEPMAKIDAFRDNSPTDNIIPTSSDKCKDIPSYNSRALLVGYTIPKKKPERTRRQKRSANSVSSTERTPTTKSLTETRHKYAHGSSSKDRDMKGVVYDKYHRSRERSRSSKERNRGKRFKISHHSKSISSFNSSYSSTSSSSSYYHAKSRSSKNSSRYSRKYSVKSAKTDNCRSKWKPLKHIMTEFKKDRHAPHYKETHKYHESTSKSKSFAKNVERSRKISHKQSDNSSSSSYHAKSQASRHSNSYPVKIPTTEYSRSKRKSFQEIERHRSTTYSKHIHKYCESASKSKSLAKVAKYANTEKESETRKDKFTKCSTLKVHDKIESSATGNNYGVHKEKTSQADLNRKYKHAASSSSSTNTKNLHKNSAPVLKDNHKTKHEYVSSKYCSQKHSRNEKSKHSLSKSDKDRSPRRMYRSVNKGSNDHDRKHKNYSLDKQSQKETTQQILEKAEKSKAKDATYSKSILEEENTKTQYQATEAIIRTTESENIGKVGELGSNVAPSSIISYNYSKIVQKHKPDCSDHKSEEGKISVTVKNSKSSSSATSDNIPKQMFESIIENKSHEVGSNLEMDPKITYTKTTIIPEQKDTDLLHSNSELVSRQRDKNKDLVQKICSSHSTSSKSLQLKKMEPIRQNKPVEIKQKISSVQPIKSQVKNFTPGNPKIRHNSGNNNKKQYISKPIVTSTSDSSSTEGIKSKTSSKCSSKNRISTEIMTPASENERSGVCSNISESTKTMYIQPTNVQQRKNIASLNSTSNPGTSKVKNDSHAKSTNGPQRRKEKKELISKPTITSTSDSSSTEENSESEPSTNQDKKYSHVSTKINPVTEQQNKTHITSKSAGISKSDTSSTSKKATLKNKISTHKNIPSIQNVTSNITSNVKGNPKASCIVPKIVGLKSTSDGSTSQIKESPHIAMKNHPVGGKQSETTDDNSNSDSSSTESSTSTTSSSSTAKKSIKTPNITSAIENEPHDRSSNTARSPKATIHRASIFQKEKDIIRIKSCSKSGISQIEECPDIRLKIRPVIEKQIKMACDKSNSDSGSKERSSSGKTNTSSRKRILQNIESSFKYEPHDKYSNVVDHMKPSLIHQSNVQKEENITRCKSSSEPCTSQNEKYPDITLKIRPVTRKHIDKTNDSSNSDSSSTASSGSGRSSRSSSGHAAPTRKITLGTENDPADVRSNVVESPKTSPIQPSIVLQEENTIREQSTSEPCSSNRRSRRYTSLSSRNKLQTQNRALANVKEPDDESSNVAGSREATLIQPSNVQQRENIIGTNASSEPSTFQNEKYFHITHKYPVGGKPIKMSDTKHKSDSSSTESSSSKSSSSSRSSSRNSTPSKNISSSIEKQPADISTNVPGTPKTSLMQSSVIQQEESIISPVSSSEPSTSQIEKYTHLTHRTRPVGGKQIRMTDDKNNSDSSSTASSSSARSSRSSSSNKNPTQQNACAIDNEPADGSSNVVDFRKMAHIQPSTIVQDKSVIEPQSTTEPSASELQIRPHITMRIRPVGGKKIRITDKNHNSDSSTDNSSSARSDRSSCNKIPEEQNALAIENEPADVSSNVIDSPKTSQLDKSVIGHQYTLEPSTSRVENYPHITLRNRHLGGKNIRMTDVDCNSDSSSSESSNSMKSSSSSSSRSSTIPEKISSTVEKEPADENSNVPGSPKTSFMQLSDIQQEVKIITSNSSSETSSSRIENYPNVINLNFPVGGKQIKITDVTENSVSSSTEGNNYESHCIKSSSRNSKAEKNSSTTIEIEPPNVSSNPAESPKTSLMQPSLNQKEENINGSQSRSEPSTSQFEKYPHLTLRTHPVGGKPIRMTDDNYNSDSSSTESSSSARSSRSSTCNTIPSQQNAWAIENVPVDESSNVVDTPNSSLLEPSKKMHDNIIIAPHSTSEPSTNQTDEYPNGINLIRPVGGKQIKITGDAHNSDRNSKAEKISSSTIEIEPPNVSSNHAESPKTSLMQPSVNQKEENINGSQSRSEPSTSQFEKYPHLTLRTHPVAGKPIRMTDDDYNSDSSSTESSSSARSSRSSTSNTIPTQQNAWAIENEPVDESSNVVDTPNSSLIEPSNIVQDNIITAPHSTSEPSTNQTDEYPNVIYLNRPVGGKQIKITGDAHNSDRNSKAEKISSSTIEIEPPNSSNSVESQKTSIMQPSLNQKEENINGSQSRSEPITSQFEKYPHLTLRTHPVGGKPIRMTDDNYNSDSSSTESSSSARSSRSSTCNTIPSQQNAWAIENEPVDESSNVVDTPNSSLIEPSKIVQDNIIIAPQSTPEPSTNQIVEYPNVTNLNLPVAGKQIIKENDKPNSDSNSQETTISVKLSGSSTKNITPPQRTAWSDSNESADINSNVAESLEASHTQLSIFEPAENIMQIASCSEPSTIQAETSHTQPSIFEPEENIIQTASCSETSIIQAETSHTQPSIFEPEENIIQTVSCSEPSTIQAETSHTQPPIFEPEENIIQIASCSETSIIQGKTSHTQPSIFEPEENIIQTASCSEPSTIQAETSHTEPPIFEPEENIMQIASCSEPSTIQAHKHPEIIHPVGEEQIKRTNDDSNSDSSSSESSSSTTSSNSKTSRYSTKSSSTESSSSNQKSEKAVPILQDRSVPEGNANNSVFTEKKQMNDFEKSEFKFVENTDISKTIDEDVVEIQPECTVEEFSKDTSPNKSAALNVESVSDDKIETNVHIESNTSTATGSVEPLHQEIKRSDSRDSLSSSSSELGNLHNENDKEIPKILKPKMNVVQLFQKKLRDYPEHSATVLPSTSRKTPSFGKSSSQDIEENPGLNVPNVQCATEKLLSKPKKRGCTEDEIYELLGSISNTSHSGSDSSDSSSTGTSSTSSSTGSSSNSKSDTKIVQTCPKVIQQTSYCKDLIESLKKSTSSKVIQNPKQTSYGKGLTKSLQDSKSSKVIQNPKQTSYGKGLTKSLQDSKSSKVIQNPKQTSYGKGLTKSLQDSKSSKVLQDPKQTSDGKHLTESLPKRTISNLSQNEKGKTGTVKTGANMKGKRRGKLSALQKAKSRYSSYFNKCYKLPPNTKPMSHINVKRGDNESQRSKIMAGRQASEVKKQSSFCNNSSDTQVSKQKTCNLSSSDSDDCFSKLKGYDDPIIKLTNVKKENNDKQIIQKQKPTVKNEGKITSYYQQKKNIHSTYSGKKLADREKITKEEIVKKLKDFEQREKEGKLPNVRDVVEKIRTLEKFHNPGTNRIIKICSPGKNMKRPVELNRRRVTKPKPKIEEIEEIEEPESTDPPMRPQTREKLNAILKLYNDCRRERKPLLEESNISVAREWRHILQLEQRLKRFETKSNRNLQNISDSEESS